MASNWFHPRDWKLAHGKTLNLGPSAVIMGILNVTPDSFSDGGLHVEVDKAVEMALNMQGQGAQIIDVGGESTRPGAKPVSACQEHERILPVIQALAREDILISIDTYRASTAKLAIKAGAHIINDVWGFQKDEDMATVAADCKAGCCAMHTGRQRTKLADLMDDQKEFLGRSLIVMLEAGVLPEQIVLDPGFGFAKDMDDNLSLLARFEELHALGYPLLAGTSRKRFIGELTGKEVAGRDVATAATNVIARMKGAAVFRVHDVAVNLDALRMTDGILSAAEKAT